MLRVAKCLCCEKDLNGFRDPSVISVGTLENGLWFRAPGNSGSEVFNPFVEEQYLEIAVCDECVLKKSKRVARIFDVKEKAEASIGSFEPVS